MKQHSSNPCFPRHFLLIGHIFSQTLTWNCTSQVMDSLSPGAKSHTVSRCLKRCPSVHTACERERERERREGDIPHFMTDIKIPRRATKPSRHFLFPHPNFAIGDEGEVRGVALHQRRESNFQLGLKVPRLFLDEAGLPAPRHKVLVLVHVGHHVVQLLRRIPGTNQAVGGGGSS